MTYLFSIDVETTGLCPIRNDVISIGLVVANQRLEMVDQIYLKVKPDIYMGVTSESVASHIHGFKLSEMILFQDRRKAIIELLTFLKKYKKENNMAQPFLFHALKNFDYLFLEWLFRKENCEYSFYKIFDQKLTYSSIDLARSLNYQDNKLSKWSERLGKTFNHHTAIDDAKMCLNVFKYIMDNHFNGKIFDMLNHIKGAKE